MSNKVTLNPKYAIKTKRPYQCYTDKDALKKIYLNAMQPEF